MGALLAGERAEHERSRQRRVGHVGAGPRPGRHPAQRPALWRMRWRRLPDRPVGCRLDRDGPRVRARYRRSRRRVLRPPRGVALRGAGCGRSHGQHQPFDDEVGALHRAGHAGTDRCRWVCRLQPRGQAGRLVRRRRRRPLRRRWYLFPRGLPAGGELSDAGQQPQVLPGLLHEPEEHHGHVHEADVPARLRRGLRRRRPRRCSRAHRQQHPGVPVVG